MRKLRKAGVIRSKMRTDGDVCVWMWIRCQGGRSWLLLAVGTMLCHKLRNELAEKR